MKKNFLFSVILASGVGAYTPPAQGVKSGDDQTVIINDQGGEVENQEGFRRVRLHRIESFGERRAKAFRRLEKYHFQGSLLGQLVLAGEPRKWSRSGKERKEQVRAYVKKHMDHGHVQDWLFSLDLRKAKKWGISDLWTSLLMSYNVMIKQVGDKKLWEHVNDLDLRGLSILPKELRFCREAKRINITKSSIDHLPEWVGEWQEAEQIIFSETNIQVLPDSVGQWEKADYIEISSSQLMELPPAVGQWTRTRFFKFNGNHLSSLPQEVSHWRSALGISFESNQLRSLPSSMGYMKNEHLRLYLAENSLKNLPLWISDINVFALSLDQKAVPGFKLGLGKKSRVTNLSELMVFLWEKKEESFDELISFWGESDADEADESDRVQ